MIVSKIIRMFRSESGDNSQPPLNPTSCCFHTVVEKSNDQNEFSVIETSVDFALLYLFTGLYSGHMVAVQVCTLCDSQLVKIMTNTPNLQEAFKISCNIYSLDK